MITKLREIDYRSSLHNPITDIYCESTDAKPTTDVETNALCYELDTMKPNGKRQAGMLKDILLSKIVGGGGGPSVTIEPLFIIQNGTYTAEEGKAYTPVTANIPQAEPIEVSTAGGMAALLVAENVGKAFVYTGETTTDYIKGDVYLVEEGS